MPAKNADSGLLADLLQSAVSHAYDAGDVVRHRAAVEMQQKISSGTMAIYPVAEVEALLAALRDDTKILASPNSHRIVELDLAAQRVHAALANWGRVA